MLKKFKQTNFRRDVIIPLNPKYVNSVEISENRKTRLNMYDGRHVDGFCIGCIEPRCINYTESELKLIDIIIPQDSNDIVCPFYAIGFNSITGLLEIDPTSCTGCGMCIKRCPFGALSIIDNKAIVNYDNAMQPQLNNHINPTKTLNVITNRYLDIKKIGKIREVSEKNLDGVLSAFDIGSKDVHFPNILTRNLLIENGLRTIIRRKGDNIIRFDGISQGDGKLFILEIEFAKDVLEAPRAILDDLAIVYDKLGISRNEFNPIIVLNELPNKRAEYWRVIDDIYNVLGIHIDTITIGGLLILLWSNLDKNFNFGRMMDYENQTLRKFFMQNININDIDQIGIGFISVLEPIK
jgi:ferredoxin